MKCINCGADNPDHGLTCWVCDRLLYSAIISANNDIAEAGAMAQMWAHSIMDDAIAKGYA